ncbi:hypothetical protein FHS31_001581 [Sphingomonas vulcanisoli]|uniref:Uncharacterized protein n=1 Tax=Sphingomonas vulcanisoli TaxID=1658060 RepID=A0ABX0TR96_9SPHN|nr:hypothetical protein [Sphingomonas vulcanisoli]NIJ07971.1 hypothetical protein [Sphingomonas vulcanisoli]
MHFVVSNSQALRLLQAGPQGSAFFVSEGKMGKPVARRTKAAGVPEIRRSRASWAWIDGSDAPLGEDGESYRVTIALAGGGGRTLNLGVAAYDYAPADQAADGMTAAAGTLSLEQLGVRATSRPATLAWSF